MVSGSSDSFSPRRLCFIALVVAASATIASCASSSEGARDRVLPAAGTTDSASEQQSVRAAEETILTAANLVEHERFWPYQIQLTEAWKPEGWDGDFGWGLGVFLTADAEQGIRVDFGRFGKHWIPVGVTDAVERANRIRLGTEWKFGPNLVVALRNRLLDPSGRELVPYPVDPGKRPAIVLVHADPNAESFAPIARSTASWAQEESLLLVLLPQGEVSDALVYRACFDAGWKGAFVLDRFANAYSEGYLESDRRRPHVQVLTREGRILLSEPFDPGMGERIRAVARASAVDSAPGSTRSQIDETMTE